MFDGLNPIDLVAGLHRGTSPIATGPRAVFGADPAPRRSDHGALSSGRRAKGRRRSDAGLDRDGPAVATLRLLRGHARPGVPRDDPGGGLSNADAPRGRWPSNAGPAVDDEATLARFVAGCVTEEAAAPLEVHAHAPRPSPVDRDRPGRPGRHPLMITRLHPGSGRRGDDSRTDRSLS